MDMLPWAPFKSRFGGRFVLVKSKCSVPPKKYAAGFNFYTKKVSKQHYINW